VFLLVLAAVALLGAGVTSGIVYENDHWSPIYARASAEAAQSKQDAHDQQQVSMQLQGQLTELNRKVFDTVGDLNHPSFVLWNSCSSAGPDAGCPLRPGYEYVGGVPDTFTYNVRFRSTVPVTVEIYSTKNFVCWETRACGANGIGWQNQTELNGVFHDAEGCAGYIAVFVSKQPGTLYPNVSVTRNPAAQSTGACA
jgi:hypothetical protein